MTPLPASASLHCLSGPLGTLLTCRTLGHFYHLTFWVTCCIMNCKLFTRLTSPLCVVDLQHTRPV